MKPTLNEKFLAYLALLSGITLSVVAEYYSILGLTAIFSAAVIPVIIMGIALGLGKVTATLWLKQNWKIAGVAIRSYLIAAIAILMLITSMGIFGFLSKAHSDQTLVSGDVQSKIAIYDEKIKTAKENIDANRKGLKQLDDAVDQVMGRSTDEKGADKAVAIRRSQSKERARLIADIEAEQKTISRLNEEAAPIRAEVRKVEAEVGPIKYIAAFVYGETSEGILERAVTWVIITLIVVFDPLALILLLSSQISFQNFREREDPNQRELEEFADAFNEVFEEELSEGDSPNKDPDNIVEGQPTVTQILPEEPVKEEYVKWPGGQEPLFCYKCATELVNAPGIGFFCPNKSCDVMDGPFADDEPAVAVEEIVTPPAPEIIPPVPVIAKEETKIVRTKIFPRRTIIVPAPETYVQNEEQTESNLWSSTTESVISAEDYKRIAKEKRDREIVEYAEKVRSRQMSMTEVPEEFQSIVKTMV